MSNKLRILTLAGEPATLEHIQRELANCGLEASVRSASTLDQALSDLRGSAPDLVLAEFNSAGGGNETLAALRKEFPELPVIVVSPQLEESAAVNWLEQGAADAVSLAQAKRLGLAIHRALREAELKREQQRLEHALHESGERFHAIFEGAGTGIAIEDLQGRIVETNRVLQQMLGFSGEELRQITRKDFTHTQDHREETAQFHRLLEGALDHYQAEKRFVRRDGRIFWGRLMVAIVRDSAGRPQFPVFMVEDITERQRAEEAHMQYQAIVESSNDAIVSMTFDGIIFSWNPAAEKLYGYAAREANGHPVSLCVPPELESELGAALERIRDGDRVDSYETVRLRKDGSRIHVSSTLSPIRDSTGRVIGVSSFSRDITGRKMAEEALRLSEARNQKLAAFAQFNPNPVMELAADGTVCYANDAAEGMAQALGKGHIAEVLPPGTADIVAKCLATMENKVRLETVVLNRTISWSFFPIKNSGVVHCYAADVTERQNLEAQLWQAQKMESVGQLAGGIAHDFNNILTVIQGHASLLGMARLAAESQDSAQQISYAAERAANLTRQLLTFSRRQVLQPKNLDLNEVVGNMTRMLRRLLGEDIILQVNYGPNLPLVHADPGMMEQILMNLSVNARDAMPRGGRLFVDTFAARVDEAMARQHADARPGEYVCLRVRDTGKGISPDVLPRIFEPFFTTKDVGKGTGLGLATVYGIVQQHRGWLRVASKVDEETVFEVYLPATAGHAAATDAPPEPEIRGGNETILVVEDEGPLRQLVRNVLKRYGYTVLEANSGVDALPIWLEHRDGIRLLLTDMVMPHGVSGRELALRLRGDKPDLRVIYSSGYSLAVVGADMVLREGLNFLQKPYHPRKLAQAVRDCLDG